MKVDLFSGEGSRIHDQISRSYFRRAWISALFLAAFAIAGLAPAHAVDNSKVTPQLLRNVGIDQRLNEQVPLDLTFRDETGKTIKLADYFGKKPVVLSLVYFHCPMLCTMVENGLLNTLKTLKFDVGDEFNVLTVSFDPKDTPDFAAAKRAIYVGMYDRKGAAQGWHFLTGDEPSIQALTKAVGFRYNYDPETGEYAHATAIMVLTPQGKLSRYFYGIQYPAGDLRLALVEASDNKIGNPVDELLLLCCRYNPATGKYGLIISRALQIAGLITIVCLGTLFLVISRAKRHSNA